MKPLLTEPLQLDEVKRVTDDASMISGLNCLRCYQRSLVNPEKEE